MAELTDLLYQESKDGSIVLRFNLKKANFCGLLEVVDKYKSSSLNLRIIDEGFNHSEHSAWYTKRLQMSGMMKSGWHYLSIAPSGTDSDTLSAYVNFPYQKSTRLLLDIVESRIARIGPGSDRAYRRLKTRYFMKL